MKSQAILNTLKYEHLELLCDQVTHCNTFTILNGTESPNEDYRSSVFTEVISKTQKQRIQTSINNKTTFKSLRWSTSPLRMKMKFLVVVFKKVITVLNQNWLNWNRMRQICISKVLNTENMQATIQTNKIENVMSNIII